MIRQGLVVLLIAIISYYHLLGNKTAFELHVLHQQLFFVPIILASFWFRLRAGLIVALIVSGIYSLTMLYHMNSAEIRTTVYVQMALYVGTAFLIGWLAERLHKQQQQLIIDAQSRTITKLASALSQEILDIVCSLEKRHEKRREANRTDMDLDYQEEINKLKRLTKAFEKFQTQENHDPISRDVNEILKPISKRFTSKAKAANISIAIEADPAGCPSMIINNTIIQLLEALVENALEASPKGSKIIIRSKRKGTHCLLEVIDQGHGVSKENVSKLFEPFFTTKFSGHGLSLAAGKKVMKNYGGDLLYEPGENGGSIFKLIVPRENINTNIDEYISERIGRHQENQEGSP